MPACRMNDASSSGTVTNRLPPCEAGTYGTGASIGFPGFFSGAGAELELRRTPNFFFAGAEAAEASAFSSASSASTVVWRMNMPGEETANAACGAWKSCGSDHFA